jgi:hypothetical protein
MTKGAPERPATGAAVERPVTHSCERANPNISSGLRFWYFVESKATLVLGSMGWCSGSVR